MYTLTKLKKQGFDQSVRTGKGRYHVACSQCEASVLNGIACHEQGCVNQVKKDHDGRE